MLEKIESNYSPTRAIHQGDLLLRQDAVANQMFQRDQVAAINLITLKTRAAEEKAKLAELLAEELFLIKRQMGENEAEKLKVHQQIAKAKII